MTPKQVLELAKKNKAVMVDLKFIDFPGLWQHFSVPITELKESSFTEGFGFDGSSIRGWQAIHASDMLILPDPTTAMMDPFRKFPTLSLICNIIDPVTKEPYTRDPRYIAQKAEKYLKSHRHRRHLLLRPRGRVLHLRRRPLRPERPQRLLLRRFRRGHLELRPDEMPNLGYKPRHKEGYFPVPPTDKLRGPPHRDGHPDAGMRHRRRGPAP